MSRARGLAVLIACWAALQAALPASGSGQTAVPAGQRPSYRLWARLDPDVGVVYGREHIRFVNGSRAALSELFFHLYANAFANGGTVFMREDGESLRGHALEQPGRIVLEKLEGESAGLHSDLLAHARDDLISGDRTQLRVPLPAPLAPGAVLELDVEFELHVPSIVARMGRAGDFFMVAQWYPKLAKLEPDGQWVSFPYHGLGEFYADFADHELELEVPHEYVIAAPGTLLAAHDTTAGTRVERYTLNDALDVAWAAYPGFRRERMQAGTVELEAFAPPGHSALARAQLALMAGGLRQLGARLGAYPYSRLVLVLPPADGYGASGMEYPGLIVGASASWHSELDGISGIVHDATTTHELAHQWFPLLCASDEVQAPVLDEGLAQWLGLDLLRARYGRAGFWQQVAWLPADAFEVLRAGFVRGAQPPSSLLPAWRYRPRELGPAVYARPALVLETLNRSFERGRVWRALGRYAREQRHRHPQLNDLFAAFDAEYGAGFARTKLEPLLAGQPSDLHLRAGAKCATAVLADRGDAGGAVPLSTELELSTPSDARGGRPWPASTPKLETRCDPELIGAELDPLRHNLLDRSRLDDQVRLATSAPQPPWLARLLYWAQLALALVGA